MGIGSSADEPRSPEAGHWFDYQVKQLAANAIDTNWPAPVPPSPPQPPSPKPPSPKPPSPAPADCPGGSLSVCLGFCPKDDDAAYQACVSTCLERCSGETMV